MWTWISRTTTQVTAALTAYNSGQGQVSRWKYGKRGGRGGNKRGFFADDTDFTPSTLIASSWRAIADASSGKLPQKRASSIQQRVTQSGADNQSALRATTAAAVKANVSIYSMDIRGLQHFHREERRNRPAYRAIGLFGRRLC